MPLGWDSKLMSVWGGCRPKVSVDGYPASVAAATSHLFGVEFVTSVKVADMGSWQLPVVGSCLWL
jgi:hypothetical protein